MVDFYLEKLWEGLSEDEKKYMWVFSPFRSAINLGEPIIASYIQQLLLIHELVGITYETCRDLCNRLVNHGLAGRVEAFPETEMFSLVHGIGHWLSQKMEKEGDKQLVENIHIAFVSHMQEMAGDLYDMWGYTPKEERQENLAFISCEYDNLLQALEWGIRLKDYYFSHILLVLETYWHATQQDQERLRVSHLLKKRLEEVPDEHRDDHYRYALVHVIDSMAAAFIQLKDYPAAIIHYREGLALYYKLGLKEEYPEAERSFYQNLASAYGFLEKWEKSNANYEKAVEIARIHNDQEGVADYHLNVGKNLLNLQQHKEAYTHFQEAVHLFTELKIPDWLGISLGYQGFIAMLEKDYESASTHFNQALVIFEALGDKLREAGVLRDYSLMELSRYKYNRAIVYVRKAIEIFISLGNKEQEGMSYLIMFGASIGEKKLEDSLAYLNRATTIFQDLGDTRKVEMSLNFGRKLSEYLESEMSTQEVSAMLENIFSLAGPLNS
ncbi:MAG: tetratricopeptide repeat protein [Bacteroidota bacterium]